MYSLKLGWLGFPVSLPAVESWIKTNFASSGYVGNSADTQLTLWFSNDPSGISAAIQEYWSELTPESEEALSYQTQSQIMAAAAATKAAALASATSKLEALGLSSAEIAALIGQ